MRVAIIGLNSLLASYIIEEFSLQQATQLLLFGREQNKISNSEKILFRPFSYPENVFEFSELLTCDIVVYCAATGVQADKPVDTSLIYEINAFFPIRIVNYLSDNNFLGKWISFGSYFEIGSTNAEHAFTEEEVVASTFAIPNHYCSSKRLLTRFVSNELFSIKAFHFILPTIYGVRENPTRLIPYIVAALKEERTLQLSAGTQVRQYLHCKDVASLVKLITTAEYLPGIYNLINEEPVQIATVVDFIFSLFQKDAQVFMGTLSTRDEGMKWLSMDAEKVRINIPQWKPSIAFQAGIKEYI